MKQLIIFFMVIFISSACLGQTKMIINKYNGTADSLNLSDIKSITFKTSIPFSNGLIAWFPFNGNANDSSGNGNDGTIYGTSPTTDRFGNANKAYYFNGSSDSIICSGAANLNFGTNDFSICFWMKGVNDDHPIMSKTIGSADGGDIGWQIHNEQHAGYGQGVRFDISDGTTSTRGLVYSTAACDNQWRFVCFVATRSSKIVLYVDGVNKSEADISGYSNINSPAPLRLGTRGGYSYLGSLDDVRIYNRALSDSEIQSLFNEGK